MKLQKQHVIKVKYADSQDVALSPVVVICRCWSADCFSFQAVFPPSRLAFSLAALQVWGPTKSLMIPEMFGCPSVGILRICYICCIYVLQQDKQGLRVLRLVILISCVFQLHLELWLASWERDSTDPGSSCQLAWWLELGNPPHGNKQLTCTNIFLGDLTKLFFHGWLQQ